MNGLVFSRLARPESSRAALSPGSGHTGKRQVSRELERPLPGSFHIKIKSKIKTQEAEGLLSGFSWDHTASCPPDQQEQQRTVGTSPRTPKAQGLGSVYLAKRRGKYAS